MDRTIHYFQDRTEYGSYDPIFPGYDWLILIRGPYNSSFRPELSKIVVQIRNTYPKFHEKSKNPKLIPKLDMTLFKKSKNPKLIPKLDITLLILGPNQLIPIPSISRIWENEENPFSSISRIWEIRKIRFPVFPGYEKIVKIKFPNISRIGLN